ncbi:DegV family protein [Streptococcus sp. DD11]|nr:DegV family protein [Streptococcus sp. DD11]
MLVTKLNDLIKQDLSFEEIAEVMTRYQEKTKLLFVLAKVDNLVKNGRLNKLLGAVVGLLNIRMVGEASPTGTLELLQKARGPKKALTAAIDELLKGGYKGGRIIMAHRSNEKFCQQFAETVRETFPQAAIEIIPTSGLCSFYAEEGGILMGYEI